MLQMQFLQTVLLVLRADHGLQAAEMSAAAVDYFCGASTRDPLFPLAEGLKYCWFPLNLSAASGDCGGYWLHRLRVHFGGCCWSF